MTLFDVPALSISIAYRGDILYEEAFGFADNNQRLTSSHLFRIASVTKPITSVAIFKLVEQNKISLSNTIFGKDGILQEDFGKPPYCRYLEDLQVQHLLAHTGGGWGSGPNDPMFANPLITQHELISSTISTVPLEHPPGQSWAYSNFGYCLLGRVIEKVTGQTYEEFVLRHVLGDCGVSNMRIGGNTLADRVPSEVVYRGQGKGEDPYAMNIRRMDSHGGWLATPSDLVRFLTHVDRLTSGNILRPDTIDFMTIVVMNGYARGGW
jgi:CubicO group peptidase (beta-lactamase class C family)